MDTYTAPATDPHAELLRLGYTVTGSLPGQVEWRFEPALYNSYRFLLQNKSLPLQSFYLLHQRGATQSVLACLHWSVAEDKAVSQAGVPFGGPDFRSNLPLPVLELFLHCSLLELAARGITEATIRLPALGVAKEAALVAQLLTDNGFQVSESVVNHHIAISSSDYRERMHYSARRRLAKCLRHGFRFEVLPASAAAEVYHFIQGCRLAKGWSLSMTMEQLMQALELSPDRYHFFAVRDRDRIVAASIGVQVNGTTLYSYAPAHSSEYDSFSPIILLTHGLYYWCLQQGYTVLDLGTSAPQGKPSFSLIAFKQRLAGIPSLKLSFSRTIGA